MLRRFRTVRRMRRARTLSRHGQIRLTFIAGGLAVGAVAVCFALAADFVQDRFQHLIGLWRYASLVVTPLGFGASAFLASRYFPNSGGSGIPQAIAARALVDEGERRKLVSLRVAAGKILLTGLGLLCGASIGREGSTVQVGASVMYAVGHISPRRQRGLILAGAAAGVAAAFNTPLAGIVFGIEEMGRSFESRTSGLVIGTVIAGGLVSLALMGNYNYFGTTNLAIHGVSGWLAVPLCGVAGGLCGGLFSRIVVAAAGPWRGAMGRWLKSRPLLFALLCGLGVALCGLSSHDTIYGTGYHQVVDMLAGTSAPQANFGVMKWAATLLSAISGIPGGIFSPSLAVGAGLGLNLAGLMTQVAVPVMVVLGMVSYFAGVVQAPITAFVIVTEMTNDHAMLVPLMLAALIAHGTSRLICREGIYHALSHNYLPRHPRPDIHP
jgi:H+/Cl- antiporter ClcA